MRCPNCGKIVEDDSIYCTYCGDNILFEDLRNNCEVVIETTSGLIYRAGETIPRSILGSASAKVKVKYSGVYPISDVRVFSYCIYTNQGEEFWNEGHIGDGQDGELSNVQLHGVSSLPYGTYIEVGTICASFKLYGETKQVFPNRLSLYLS